MNDIHLSLSAEQKECLLRLLESSLASKRVEVHRTDSLTYREAVEHDLELIESLVAKLKPGSDVARAV